MTRIVAGTLGGRRLRVPSGRSTRPTSDRVREAMFSTLGDRVVGATVLDLFAGSGALGIEALSRGAAHATFVEHDGRAARVLRDNLDALGLQARVFGMDAARFVRELDAIGERRPYDLVLCDPPYQMSSPTLTALLRELVAGSHVVTDAMMVVERARRSDAFDADDALEVTDVRTYGETVLYYVVVRRARSEGRDLNG